MEILGEFLADFVTQLQTFTLAFLIFGMLAAALKSELEVPESIYKFAVFVLLMKIGLSSGMEIREAGWAGLQAMLLPAFISMLLGIGIVVLGSQTLARLPGVRHDDALATAGLFGAVSASTILAGMLFLDEAGISYEAWIPALYPFMDIPALITAIVLANLHIARKGGKGSNVKIWAIVKECLRGHALTALIGGVLLGLLSRPELVYEGFYDALFRGFLSILMVVLGIEAYRSLKDLFKTAHWYVAYAVLAPIVHGFLGFGLGYLAHHLVGLSPGGVIMLAIIAASNSDISGPPTIRGGIPSANPSAYIGASTGLGTPVAIGICIPLFVAVGTMVFGL
jgi:hypothetical protein